MEVTTEYYKNHTTTDNDTSSISEAIETEDLIVKRVLLEAYTLLSLLCLVTNVLTIFVILKYKRLRQEKSNVIILNWCIINIFFMAFNPTTIRLAVDWDYDVIVNSVFCIIEQLEYTLLFTNVVLMILLTLYWFMKLYSENAFVKLVNHLKFVLGVIYIFSLFFAALHIDACYNGRIYIIAEIILSLSYIAYILFTLIINVVHAIKKRKLMEYKNIKNVPFIMTNTFCLSCLPIFISIFLGSLLSPRQHLSVVCISLMICVMNPIYFFIILYKCDKDYNTFFKHILRCRCRKYNEELVEQPVVYNNA